MLPAPGAVPPMVLLAAVLEDVDPRKGIPRPRDPVRHRPDEVALDQVASGPEEERYTRPVARDHVAGRRRRPADKVVRSIRGDEDPFATVAQHGSRGVDADAVALYDVVRAAEDVDPTAVPRDDIARAGAVPPTVLLVPVMKTPARRLLTARLPVTSVPMKLPRTRLFEPLSSTPYLMFPEMTLRSAGEGPPIVLNDPPTPMPLVMLPCTLLLLLDRPMVVAMFRARVSSADSYCHPRSERRCYPRSCPPRNCP